MIIINYITFHSHVIQKGCRNFLIRRKDFWAALLSVEQWNLVKFNEVKCQSISKKLHWYLLDAHQSNYLFINTQWQYIYIVLYSLKKFNQLVRSLVNILFTLLTKLLLMTNIFNPLSNRSLIFFRHRHSGLNQKVIQDLKAC